MMECMFDFIPVFSSDQLLLISKALIKYADSEKSVDSLNARTLSRQLRQYLTADKLVLQSAFNKDSDLGFTPKDKGDNDGR